ncbi:MAG: transketolase [Burkholderiaceae bacterium]|nr:transketolase [Burkholderiaceae bacterium]
MSVESHSFSPNFSDLANAIRALAMDAVQKANSGHPGMPMGMAEIAVALWAPQFEHLKVNPADPHWPNRDRFILSNGHGSMLQYALLHLTGFDLPMSELENFRQMHSKTPGHPEVEVTPGVETTTGPLGQGIANAVGMALAEKLLAAQFNTKEFPIVDHNTYVFLGDGCLMEGISHEACSLAGTWRLSKLIAIYDDNGISIDGRVEHWFRDDTPKRFQAYGWNVIPNVDGHDIEAVDAAIKQARLNALTDQGPTLICAKTAIGKGSPNMAGTDKVHGAALGEEEIAATRVALNWPHAAFTVPQAIYDLFDLKARGAFLQEQWQTLFENYEAQYPEKAAEFKRRMRGDLAVDWKASSLALVQAMMDKKETLATRKASQQAITALVQTLPELLGGSADLTGSNFTDWIGAVPLRSSKEEGFQAGRHINYGVREFGMSAIMNGIALHGGLIPFGGTFLTFADYSRNALRMAALMRLRSIFVFTHDSIGLGEDGPTHQSVEHTASLRLIPNMEVWRPCDTVETSVAWIAALEHKTGPTSLIFSRQNLPYIQRQESAEQTMNQVKRGAYILRGAPGKKEHAVIIATGSEIALALGARDLLSRDGINVRVVSMPSTTVFDKQEVSYKETVLPRGLPRVAVEMGVTDFWWKYGCAAVIGIDRFGESAPAGVLFKHFGFTEQNVADTVKAVLAKC